MIAKIRAAVLAVAAMVVMAGATTLSAQIFTPSYASPRSTGDLGIYVADGPGDFSVEGIFRTGFGAYDFGFRAGVAGGDPARAILGVDLRNPFQVTGAPLDFAFTAGFQGVLGEQSQAGGTVGLTAGYTFVPGDFTFTPYIHPRFALISGRAESGLAGHVLADLGLDFAFDPITFRLAFGLGSPTPSWGLGVSWR